MTAPMPADLRDIRPATTYTARQVAAAVGVSDETVRNWARAGKLKRVAGGNAGFRFLGSAVLAFLELTEGDLPAVRETDRELAARAKQSMDRLRELAKPQPAGRK